VLSSPKPRTSPTAAPASLETRGSRFAFRHSDAMRTVALVVVITVPAIPESGAPRRRLTLPWPHMILITKTWFDQLQPPSGWLGERLKALVWDRRGAPRHRGQAGRSTAINIVICEDALLYQSPPHIVGCRLSL
jgi:hypothetical protein